MGAFKRANVRIVASGDIALATPEFRIAGTWDQRFDATGLELVVLRRRDGAWRFVHVHSSSPPKRPAAK